MKAARSKGPRPVHETVREYGRGLAGGLLISLPLLYTMEVWWAGFLIPPHRQLALLAFTFMLLLGYNRFAGIRHDSSAAEVVVDSLEELALGLATAFVVLALLGRLPVEDGLSHNLGRVLVEAMVISIGVAVGRAQLGDDEEEDDCGDRPRNFGGQTFLALGGAVVFAANVAVTEEIVELAVEATPLLLLGLVITSVGIGWAVLHGIGFRRSGQARRDDPLLGVLMTYTVAFAASAVMLWIFGRFDQVPLAMAVGQIVVLALPATLGASAGRFLVQS